MNSKIEIKDKVGVSSGIKVASFLKHVRKTNPHTHNSYLELVYLSKGDGQHTIDTNAYCIAPPVLYVIKENQLHFWDISSEPEGFVLIIKKVFVDQYCDYELRYLISRLQYHPEMDVAKEDAPTINTLFELLISEAENSCKPRTPFLSLLKALMAKILSSQTLQHLPANSDIYSRFTELLFSSKDLINSVAHYANLLNTTPQNLNAACKKETGNSASTILASRIIAEANRLLLYTQLSVSEISYMLGFHDNSHFSKYFKKNTGKAPSILRRHHLSTKDFSNIPFQ